MWPPTYLPTYLPIGIEISDPAIGLLTGNQVAMLAPHHHTASLGIFGNLIQNIRAALPCANHRHALPLVVLQVGKFVSG